MALDFKKIITSVKDLPGKFFRLTEGVVGIDIGTSIIKAVELKKEGGKAILETYGAIALGPYGGTEIGAVTNLDSKILAQAVTELLKEAQVTTKNAVISIPATMGLVFLIELPAAIKPAQFDSVIPTEARKFVPVPIEEVDLDWFIVPKKEEGEEIATPTEAVVVALPKDVLTKWSEVAELAGLESSVFEHEAFAELRSNITREITPTLILDFGASKTKLFIIERGIVKMAHVINRGGADISTALSRSLEMPFIQAEEVKKKEGLLSANRAVAETVLLTADFILGETASLVLQFEKKYNKAVAKVILTGGSAILPGFLAKAKEVLRTEVLLSDAFSRAEAPSFLAKTLEVSSPQFSTAIGLALKKLT